MSLPLLQYEKLHDAPVLDQKLWLEGFRFNGANYCGIQPSGWLASEQSWDNGDPLIGETRNSGRGWGRWVGPGAVHVRPGELWLYSLDENTITSERDAATNHDEIARIESGALTRAIWTWLDVGVGIASIGYVHLILQNATTGAVIEEETVAPGVLHWDLPALSGHAILWARMEGVQRDWQLPPDYLTTRGFASVPTKFQYVENGTTYVWDYEADVGRRPSDPNHAFYDLEQEAFLAGQTVHRGEWTQYIVSGAEQDGPWSALRIAVGVSAFSVGSGFVPYPGAVLNQITGTSTRTPVLIDPLALSVSASMVLEEGDDADQCRVAGTIAGRSGPMTAYWHFHPAGAINNCYGTLLGANGKTVVLMCEASLYPTVSDLLEIAPDEEEEETLSHELVLTRAFLHEYDPEASDIRDRLPGLPRATLGHPGGRCLRNDNGKLRLFTESFNQVGAREGNDRFAQFYNTGREIDLRQQVRTGNGTLFHGDNCAEMCWGSLYGWAQDGPFGEDDTQQYLAILQSGVWDDSGLAPFKADQYLWQRLRAIGTSRGTHLLACGRSAASEKPIWGLSNGQLFRESWLPFRARRLTRVTDETGKEWIYAIGRFVTQNGDGLYDVASRWSLIRLSGNYVKVCAYWDADFGDEGAFTFDRVEAAALGLDAEQMPAYLWWVVDARESGGGYWVPRAEVPEGARSYLILSYDAETVAYAPPSGMAVPYPVGIWNHFCFTVHDDGGPGDGPWTPETTCNNAQCVVDNPPGGGGGGGGGVTEIAALILFKRILGPWWSTAQVSDVSPVGESGLRTLQEQALLFPNLWARVDSEAEFDDLGTFTIPLSWDSFWNLPKEAKSRIDICVLVDVESGPLRVPALSVINNGSGQTTQLTPLPGPSNALLTEGEEGIFIVTEAGEIIVMEQA